MMFNNPFRILSQAIDENQKSSESLIKAIDDHMGITRSKLPDPLKKVATITNFARPA